MNETMLWLLLLLLIMVVVTVVDIILDNLFGPFSYDASIYAGLVAILLSYYIEHRKK